MILIIFATIISIILGYKLYESWSDKLKHIRQPWSWPFFKHYPYFWKADHLLVYEQFAKDYKQDGLFRINNLTRKYFFSYLLIQLVASASYIFSDVRLGDEIVYE